MTNSKAIQFFNSLRPVTIGFDNVFDHFEHMLDTDMGLRVPNYQPYNIVKTGQFTYDIELALAGYSKSDVAVDYADNQLTIKSIHKDEDEGETIHRGIAKRHFTRTFTIADDVEVKGAEMADGMLKVALEKIVPEGKKPRTIEIS